MSKTKEKEICPSRNIMRPSPLLFTLAVVCTASSKRFMEPKISNFQVNFTNLSPFGSSVITRIFRLPMLKWLNDAFLTDLLQVLNCFSLLLPPYHQPT